MAWLFGFGQGTDEKKTAIAPEAAPLLVAVSSTPPSVPRPDRVLLTRCPFDVGRDRKFCDLVLDSTSVPKMISRLHGTFSRTSPGHSGEKRKQAGCFCDGWVLHDKSTNGIFLNDVKMSERAVLRHGDTIVFGGGGQLSKGDRLQQPLSEFIFRFECTALPEETAKKARVCSDDLATQTQAARIAEEATQTQQMPAAALGTGADADDKPTQTQVTAFAAGDRPTQTLEADGPSDDLPTQTLGAGAEGEAEDDKAALSRVLTYSAAHFDAARALRQAGAEAGMESRSGQSAEQDTASCRGGKRRRRRMALVETEEDRLRRAEEEEAKRKKQEEDEERARRMKEAQDEASRREEEEKKRLEDDERKSREAEPESKASDSDEPEAEDSAMPGDGEPGRPRSAARGKRQRRTGGEAPSSSSDSEASGDQTDVGDDCAEPAPTPSPPLPDNLEGMTVERLRALLAARGLPMKGRKKELIERLLASV